VFAVIVGLLIVKGRTPALRPKPASSVSGVKSAAAPASVLAAKTAEPGAITRDAFDTLPNGAPVPELPNGAPKSVTFGVILLAYQGAQGAPADAPTKDRARDRARAMLPEAIQDFSEAAKKGDHGSQAEAGRVPRGVLEPAIEYVLFTLEKGTVYPEPLDTPRGFWLIKRID
jgi:hypothetical protein